MSVFKKTIDNNLAALEGFLEQFDEMEGLTAKERFNCNLVFDEMITNIIKYGYRDRHTHAIDVEVEISTEYIRIEISDNGINFDPLDNPEPDTEASLEDREIGGLGIHLVKQISDRIAHRFENGMNINEIVLERDSA